MKEFLQGARKLSPYLLIELLLPGGTLIALLLWLQRRFWPLKSRRDGVPEGCAGHCT